MKRYQIWKIKGWGRKKVRYYESKKMFKKYWNEAKTLAATRDWYDVHAFQFTSEGWTGPRTGDIHSAKG